LEGSHFPVQTHHAHLFHDNLILPASKDYNHRLGHSMLLTNPSKLIPVTNVEYKQKMRIHKFEGHKFPTQNQDCKCSTTTYILLIWSTRTLSDILLVFWPYYVFGQNHLCVKMLKQGFHFQSAVKKFKFPVSRPDDVSSRPDANLSTAPSVRTTCHPVRTPDSPATSVQTTCSFSPNPYTVSRSFCSSLHPSGRFSSTSGRLSVLERFTDSFQVPRKGRSINRPDDVVSRPDVCLHKARIAVQI